MSIKEDEVMFLLLWHMFQEKTCIKRQELTRRVEKRQTKQRQMPCHVVVTARKQPHAMCVCREK